MAERGRPSIAVPATEDMLLSGERRQSCFDVSHFWTCDGILKSIQIFLNIIGVICNARSDWSGTGGSIFYNIVGLGGFSITFMLLTLYLFHVVGRSPKINWFFYEFIYCTLWTLLLIISSSMAVHTWFGVSRTAGIFGFLAGLAYSADAFMKFNAARTGTAAQSLTGGGGGSGLC